MVGRDGRRTAGATIAGARIALALLSAWMALPAIACATPHFAIGSARSVYCEGGLVERVGKDGAYRVEYGGPCRVLEGGEISDQAAALVGGAAAIARKAATAAVGVP